jgi:HD-like signal output (HDOD) protein
LLTGAFARRIAKEEGVSQQALDEAYTAALLHDVGSLVLATHRPNEYAKVLDLARTRPVPDWSAEREVFGADHAHVGAYLLGVWGLSDGIVETVAFHHHPGDCLVAGFGAITAVHVANALAEAQAHGMAEIAGVDKVYVERQHLSLRLGRWRELCAAA